MKTTSIYVWPVGSAQLVRKIKEIPRPCEFYGAWDGYRFYRCSDGVFAVEE